MTTVTRNDSNQACRLDDAYNRHMRLFPAFDSGWAMSAHSRKPDTDKGFGRTEIGELVYRMKYFLDNSALNIVADKLATTVQMRLAAKGVPASYYSAIIPVPPSNRERQFQPVAELARRISAKVGIPLLESHLYKVGANAEMKSLKSYQQKHELLCKNVRVSSTKLTGKRILLIDDLIQTGATLDVMARTLKQQSGVIEVSVLCATQTLSRGSK